MTPNTKLIKFMRYKAKKIKELGCDIDYFNDNDVVSILSWTIKEAEEIWNLIKKYRIKGLYGLEHGNCPFCLYTECFLDGMCVECDYSRQHVECCKFYSDYHKILSYCHKKPFEGDREFFTNQFYLNLIEEIEVQDV